MKAMVDKLTQAGVDIRLAVRQTALMHNKVGIFDGTTICTGSFNWTSNAERHNDENLLVVDGPDVAGDYEQYVFQRIMTNETLVRPTDRMRGVLGSQWHVSTRRIDPTWPMSAFRRRPRLLGPAELSHPKSVYGVPSLIIEQEGVMIGNPWEDPAVREFIDEWLQQQTKCVRATYPGCYIDRWGRMCGNTGSTVITCANDPDDTDGSDNYYYLWRNNWCPQYYPYRVQDYVKARKAGTSADSLAHCKLPAELCADV
jgi:hypothetical protein